MDWTAILERAGIPDSPGRSQAAAAALDRYGWAVLVGGPRASGGGDTHSHIAVTTVSDWEKALATGPYRWLNTHPAQPAPPEKTKALAVETWTRLQKQQKCHKAPASASKPDNGPERPPAP